MNLKAAMRKESALSSVEIDATGTIKFEAINLKQMQLSYYIINAELLFTRQPFLLEDNQTEEFSFVKPYFELMHQILPENATDH